MKSDIAWAEVESIFAKINHAPIGTVELGRMNP